MSTRANIQIRLAVPADIPALGRVIEASVRGLQAGDYTPAQIEAALESVYGVDSQLIADATYFVAEAAGAEAGSGEAGSGGGQGVIAGCGGWSKRRTLYGGDHCAGREDAPLDPARDAARIRAFFVHPAWARRGIGSMILEACEAAAKAAGYCRLEMGATLAGVAFYEARGYVCLEPLEAPLGDGTSLAIVRMAKRI